MEVRYLDEAERELLSIPVREQAAMTNVIEKLRANAQLGSPHSSKVMGADRLRELRPRQGRSPWRALYRRIGLVFYIAAIAPEAQHDSAGYQRAVTAAERRLDPVQRKHDVT